MAATYLNYAVRKKMVSQQLQDISQLIDIGRQIKKLNLEKEQFKKHEYRKDKGHYVALVDKEEFLDDVLNETTRKTYAFDISYQIFVILLKDQQIFC